MKRACFGSRDRFLSDQLRIQAFLPPTMDTISVSRRYCPSLYLFIFIIISLEEGKIFFSFLSFYSSLILKEKFFFCWCQAFFVIWVCCMRLISEKKLDLFGCRVECACVFHLCLWLSICRIQGFWFLGLLGFLGFGVSLSFYFWICMRFSSLFWFGVLVFSSFVIWILISSVLGFSTCLFSHFSLWWRKVF